MQKKIKFSIGLKLVLLITVSFLAGRGVGLAVDTVGGRPVQEDTLEYVRDGAAESVKEGVLEAEADSWGLSFREEGKPPVANVSGEELAKYNAYYIEDTEEKVLYLTFDAGFENGNTPAILDALKKLEGLGVSILVCGTCLDYYHLLEQKKVGRPHLDWDSYNNRCFLLP